mmetsp:Transcript_16289/g.35284  ORF Transcript_16289/g.35284 Transcript_16289/m.35284 type:complete len:203 (+) Transcript_16289:88-696(+)
MYVSPDCSSVYFPPCPLSTLHLVFPHPGHYIRPHFRASLLAAPGRIYVCVRSSPIFFEVDTSACLLALWIKWFLQNLAMADGLLRMAGTTAGAELLKEAAAKPRPRRVEFPARPRTQPPRSTHSLYLSKTLSGPRPCLCLYFFSGSSRTATDQSRSLGYPEGCPQESCTLSLSGLPLHRCDVHAFESKRAQAKPSKTWYISL